MLINAAQSPPKLYTKILLPYLGSYSCRRALGNLVSQMAGLQEARKWGYDYGNAGSYLIPPKYLLEPEAGKHYDI